MVAVRPTSNVAEVAPAAPITRPRLILRTGVPCPLCDRQLDERVRGLYCPVCKGWLVEQPRDGQVVVSLWQGLPF